jgi:hypothetical protein
MARLTSAADAADAVGADDVDLVIDVLHAWHAPDGLLHKLLQIKGRQPAGQHKASALLLDIHIGDAPAEMGVPFQELSGQ